MQDGRNTESFHDTKDQDKVDQIFGFDLASINAVRQARKFLLILFCLGS